MKSTTKQAKQSQRSLYPFVKIISLVLIAVIAVSCFGGCEKQVVSTVGNLVEDTTRQTNAPQSVTASNSITLGCSEEDSLNPFFMTTDLNHDLISLVYEPLFYIDDSFCAVNALAVGYEQKGTALTVRLDGTAMFSDGSKLSAADVVYSFNKAKESASYKNELSVVASAAAGSDSVTFTLTANYANAVDSLSFPIVKASTAENKDTTPIGTGLYKYNASGENVKLEYNSYCRTSEPSIKTITLTIIPASSTLIHTLELGEITAYFDDMSSGSYSRAGASSAKTNLTNLVFLGMNSSSYGLQSAAFRQAVYFSVNRQSIVKNSFKKYAVETYTPYHPQWHILEKSDYDTSKLALDYSKAKNLLQQAGFKGTTNLRLIVYSGNSFKVSAAREIKESLANVGINAVISELTWEQYKAALSSGEYDLYIGEIKLPLNMNMTSLFNGTVTGVSAADTTKNAYGEYEKGNISINAFSEAFLQNMPFAPICFRMGALIYDDGITPAADCDVGNVYKNIQEWNLAISAENASTVS